ncbi:hypothetical protein TNCV_2471241 [Trichonephila clavipes]|nr:hypothetical protein TNCV_2471241 [Trichonephila clavipes]
MTSWASHEIERSGGNVTAYMERNLSRHHKELVCLKVDRIASCIRARGDSAGILLMCTLKLPKGQLVTNLILLSLGQLSRIIPGIPLFKLLRRTNMNILDLYGRDHFRQSTWHFLSSNMTQTHTRQHQE